MEELRTAFESVGVENVRALVDSFRQRLPRVREAIPRAGDSDTMPAARRQAARAHLRAVREKAEECGFAPLCMACALIGTILGDSKRLLPSQTYVLASAVDFLGACAQYVSMLLEKMPPPEGFSEALERSYEVLAWRAQQEAAETEDDASSAASLRLRVLVSDDEEIIRHYLFDMIQQCGHEVTLASDGRQAIDAVNNNVYDLVISDVKMPGADGIEVLKAVKEVSPETEVVIVTGFASVENAAQAVRYGAYDYLTKPFDQTSNIRGMLQRVCDAIQLKRENRRLMMELSLRNEELRRYVAALEEALRAVKEKQKALVRADRMSILGVLSAGMAHEINNPTTYIRGNLQTLKKFWETIDPLLRRSAENADAQTRTSLQFMLEETPDLIGDMLLGTERITKIVSGLRSFVHPSHVTETRRRADVIRCIEDALSLVASQFRKTVTIERRFESETIDLLIAPQQITQVFVNLFLNGLHALEPVRDARLTIRARREGEECIIEVKDNGVGMDRETVSKVFDPFFTTKSVGKGTGLGLSIAQGILNDHEAKIRVASAPRKGTEFVLRFPLPEGEAPAGDHPKRLLLVDDDADMAELMSKLLGGDARFELRTASGGFQAIYLFDDYRPDIMIVDMHLPDMDGLQVIEHIRAAPSSRQVRILVLTGFSAEEVYQRAESLGIDAVIHKPFRVDDLIGRIESLVFPGEQPEAGRVESQPSHGGA